MLMSTCVKYVFDVFTSKWIYLQKHGENTGNVTAFDKLNLEHEKQKNLINYILTKLSNSIQPEEQKDKNQQHACFCLVFECTFPQFL